MSTNDSKLTDTFTNPGNEWRGKPFWSWNGELRAEELIRQVGVMKEMELGGFFMHSRAGLITEYLGDEWFELINAVADAGEKAGMEAWLYDEDRWPSGSAGGKVTVDERYREKSLYVYETDPAGFSGRAPDTVAVFAAKIDGINAYGYVPVPAEEDPAAVIAAQAPRYETAPGSWKVLHFRVVPDAPEDNFNGTTYIDTMDPAAVRRFIELTHEKYREKCGDRLGRSIKGIFSDEPHRGHLLDNYKKENGVVSCAVCWTDALPAAFRDTYGYDLLAQLPALFYRPDGQRVAPVKLHFIDLCDNLFLEAFAKQINEWCRENNIIFTGHVLHEDSLMNQTVPEGSLMRVYEHMGYPGVDCLTEGNKCYWVVKQLSSVTRQLGQKYLLSEMYGCTGWQFNFKSHKAVGDWQALFGINLRCQHLSWYTMEGESKRDFPASILHQSPWYRDYSLVESYFARFGFIMSQGRADCDVLVLNPIESVWCQAYLGWSNWIFNASEDIKPYEDNYTALLHMLTDRQIDFDYGEEQMMRDRAAVEKDGDGKPVLRIGLASYHVVVVSDMLTIRPTTLALLQRFRAAGGTVIFCGDVPTFVDALPSDAPQTLADTCVCVPFDGEALAAAVHAYSLPYVSVTRADGQTETEVFAQVRAGFDGNGFAAVALNTDRQAPKKGLTLRLRTDSPMAAELWDMATGERVNADADASFCDGVTSVSFSLEAAGTVCIVFLREHSKDVLPARRYETLSTSEIKPDAMAYTLDEQNVCVLDFCRWKWEDGTWSDTLEVLRADRAVRTSVGLPYRGGSMLQPWYAKLHDKKVYGKLRLSYTFLVDTVPSGPVYLCGERPETNAYAVNGTTLAAGDVNDFWVDDCFKKMRIPAGVLHRGENEVTVAVDFMRTTNVETLYLVGDFGVRTEDVNTRVLTTLPETLPLGDFADCHLPFYTGSVTYRIPGAALRAKGADTAARILLQPRAQYAGLLKVTAQGKTTCLGWDPYCADVTDAVKSGEDVFVTVVGTRRNVFGPLHQLPAITGSYSPGSFVSSGNAWTDGYVRLPAGLEGLTLLLQK